MKHCSLRWSAAALALAIAFIARAEDKEVALKPADLPVPVIATIQKEAPGGEIVSASKETEGKRVNYEGVVKAGDKTLEITCAADGKLVGVEERTNLEAVPAKVRAAIEKKAAGKAVAKVEKILKGKHAGCYEAEIKLGEKELELTIAADGRIVASEVE